MANFNQLAQTVLFQKVVRLAKARRDLRPYLLPILREAGFFDRGRVPLDQLDEVRLVRLPPAAKGVVPVRPEGTDIVYWAWEEPNKQDPSKTQYCLVLYHGQSTKADVNVYYSSAERRGQNIQSWIAARKGHLDSQQKARSDRAEFQHTLKVGDILTGSWGYDQTNVDWYQVVKVVGKAVDIREIQSEIVKTNSQSEAVVAVPNAFLEKSPVLRKFPQIGNRIKLKSYLTIHPWDGQPEWQTDGMSGH